MKNIITFIVIFIVFASNAFSQQWISNNISFDFKSYQNDITTNVVVDQLIRISSFKAPGKGHVENIPQFRLIMGHGSLSLFDALDVDEVAGLKREDAIKHIENLIKEGKSEKDGAFIAGLTNISPTGEFFIFFNLDRLNHSVGYASRVLAHEPLHMARLLITTIENPSIDYINDPWVNLTDDNEEYFAEMIERLSAICHYYYFQ